MTFEWDEQKRVANLAKHGIDFSLASQIFHGPTIQFPDDRQDYGEARIGAFGEVGGRVLFVVFTLRNGRHRLISARTAGRQERRCVEQTLPKESTMPKDMTDTKRIDALTDAELTAAADTDPDTFIPDATWWKQARLVVPQAKETVTLRLDHEVLTWFRGAGKGYQTRIKAVLRAFVEAQSEGRP